MIEVLDLNDEKILGFRVDGKVEKEDVQNIYALLEEKAASNGKMQFYTEIEDFHWDDFSAEALKEDIRLWLKHPSLIVNVEKVALVTDVNWIGKVFDIECALIPTLEGESFSFSEKEKAIEWLKTDQREPNRMDLTYTELVETATLKFAGGFALGLLTAGLFSKKQRKNIGGAIMLGTVLAGIPLSLKVLNNNRKLLGEE